MDVHSPFGRWLSSIITIGGNAAVQAITLIVFARWFGPAEYSVIVIAAASAMVAAELVGFGAGDVLIREVSRDARAHRLYFGRALWLIGASIAPISLIAGLAALYFLPGSSTVVVLVLVASEILSIRIVALAEQISIANHDVHAANANRWIGVVVRLAAVCIAVFVADVSDAAHWSGYAVSSAAVTTILCMTLCVRRFGRPSLPYGPGKWHEAGISFTFLQLIRAAQYSLDKFVVATVAAPSVVGAYGVASRAAQLGVTPSSAITRMMYPMFFRKGQKGVGAATRLAARLSPSVIGAAFLSATALAAIAYVLPLVLGQDYSQARSFLLILAALPVAASLQNLAGSVLSGADLQAHRVWSSAVGLCLTIAAALIGAGAGGPTGAAAGYLIGHFLAALSMIAAIIACRQNKSGPHRAGAGDVRSIPLD